jgi:DNA-binding LacI/PurR family transcriptional regulator
MSKQKINTVGKRATLLSISRKAGVSTSTVSRALRGDSRISDATQLKLQQMARSEGYTPNAMARSLSTRRSNVIGLALGDLHNPFFPELLETLSLSLARVRRHLMLLQTGPGTLRDDDLESILGYQMDGCIISSANLSSRAAEICTQHKVPMVMLNRVALNRGSAVSCHNEAGGLELAQLLVEAGYRRIGMIEGNIDTSTNIDRKRGFIEGLKEAGLQLVCQTPGRSTYNGAFAAMQEIIKSSPLPEAIFAINDVMALGAIDAARRAGLRIPEDIGVVGFDDIRAASSPAYELTTMSQPREAMVERAVSILIERIENPSLADEELYIRGELKIRNSINLGSISGSGASR